MGNHHNINSQEYQGIYAFGIISANFLPGVSENDVLKEFFVFSKNDSPFWRTLKYYLRLAFP
jgi:hypothetical protein